MYLVTLYHIQHALYDGDVSVQRSVTCTCTVKALPPSSIVRRQLVASLEPPYWRSLPVVASANELVDHTQTSSWSDSDESSQVTSCSKTSGACLIREMYGMRGCIPAVYINKFANRARAVHACQRQVKFRGSNCILVGLGCDDGSVWNYYWTVSWRTALCSLSAVQVSDRGPVI